MNGRYPYADLSSEQKNVIQQYVHIAKKVKSVGSFSNALRRIDCNPYKEDILEYLKKHLDNFKIDKRKTLSVKLYETYLNYHAFIFNKSNNKKSKKSSNNSARFINCISDDNDIVYAALLTDFTVRDYYENNSLMILQELQYDRKVICPISPNLKRKASDLDDKDKKSHLKNNENSDSIIENDNLPPSQEIEKSNYLNKSFYTTSLAFFNNDSLNSAQTVKPGEVIDSNSNDATYSNIPDDLSEDLNIEYFKETILKF